MKIILNTAVTANNNINLHKNNAFGKSSSGPEKTRGNEFENISFKMAPDTCFLLGQVDTLKCFYTKKDLIDARQIKTIYSKLCKRPNAQSAVNYLQQYANNMFDVEYTIFNIFQEAEYKGKRGFPDILESMVPNSLRNIKQKQIEVFDNTEEAVDCYPNDIAKQILELKDKAVKAILDGTFQRSCFLEQLLRILPENQDKFSTPEIYRLWSKLPSAFYDYDAFVLKYHTEDHETIAKRLISPSVGTIEHVIPSSRGGEDNLGNCVLAAAKVNNPRSNLFIKILMDLHPSINMKNNMQSYIDTFVREINKGNQEYVKRSWYPESIQEKVETETGKYFVPEVKPIISVSKSQTKQNKHFVSRRTPYTVYK